MIAFTRTVPHSIARCELTHLQRHPIDVANARRQHAAYEEVLRSLGAEVRRLAALHDHPDSVFVEDTAIVLDECAVVTRPGAPSRRGETADVAEALRALRPLVRVLEPGTLDGGDVLRLGRTLYVGASSRSDEAGTRQLADALAPYGYAVVRVPVRGCLHLKTAASALPDGALLLDPRSVDAALLDAPRVLEVPEDEPQGANVLVLAGAVVVPQDAPRTRDLLESAGYRVVSVPASELAKAEGGLTCCSLLVA